MGITFHMRPTWLRPLPGHPMLRPLPQAPIFSIARILSGMSPMPDIARTPSISWRYHPDPSWAFCSRVPRAPAVLARREAAC
jgi:hypothetical protein